MLLHVLVCDDHQGARTWTWLPDDGYRPKHVGAF